MMYPFVIEHYGKVNGSECASERFLEGQCNVLGEAISLRPITSCSCAFGFADKLLPNAVH